MNTDGRGAEAAELGEDEGLAAVTFPMLRCPGCGSASTHVTRTMRPVRYHRCGACGLNFKSVEEDGG